MVIVDSSKGKVSMTDENGKISTVIPGQGTSKNSFYSCSAADSDGEYIYVADNRFISTGLKISSEHITRFDLSGVFYDTVFTREYENEDMPLQYGNIVFLQSKNSETVFILRAENKLELYKIAGDEARIESSVVLPDDIYIHRAVYNFVSGKIAVLSRKGEIYEENDNGVLTFFTKLDDYSSFNDLAIDENGNMLVSDIRNSMVINVNDGITYDCTESPFYDMSVSSSGQIVGTDSELIYYFDSNNEQAVNLSDAYSTGIIVRCCVMYAALLIIAVTAVTVIIYCIKAVKSKIKSANKKIAVVSALSVIIAAAAITYMVFSPMSERLSSKSVSHIKDVTQSISQTSAITFGDKFSNIKSLSDYKNDDYMQVRSYIDTYCDSAYENDSNLYYILFREEDGYLYGVIDYEDTISTIYPYCPLEDNNYAKVWDTEEIYLVDNSSDSYGSWVFALAPLYGSDNEKIGLIEIGCNLDSEKTQNRNILIEIIISVVVLVVLMILIITEGAVFFDKLTEIKSCKTDCGSLVRTLAFIAYAADNFCTVIIPSISEKLFISAGMVFSSSIGAALPISCNLFCLGLFSFLGGFFIDRAGIKNMMILGTVGVMAGNIVSAMFYADSYSLFLLSKIITGSSMGIIVVCLNSLPSFTADEERRSELFSDMNVGLISGVVVGTSIGSYIARMFGYYAAFTASAVFMGLMLLIALIYMNTEKKSGTEHIDSSSLKAVVKLIFNKNIITMLIFAMLPFMTIMYFKDYVFPLYALDNGYTEETAGNILLIGGVISIYIGPSITGILMKKFGDVKCIVMSLAAYIVSIVLFGLLPSMLTATFAVSVQCMAGCVGLTAFELRYSEASSDMKIASGASMGSYGLFDSLFQTLGPIIFGLFLIFGYDDACIYISVCSAVLLLLFIALNINKSNKNRRKSK